MDEKYCRCMRYDEEVKRNALDLLETTGRPIAEIPGDLKSRIAKAENRSGTAPQISPDLTITPITFPGLH